MVLLALCSPAPADDHPFTRDVLPIMQRLCFDCHGPERPKGDVTLSSYDTAESLARAPHVWRDAVRALRERAMPPKRKTQPTDAERDALIAGIEHTLATIAYEADPGPVPLRRLTRTEYNNTVRDLLGVTIRPADAFPVDGGGAGFDNHAATLYVSPILMEKYLAAASQVADAADAKLLLVVRPSDKLPPRDAARRILDHLLPRAFRRPVEPPEVDRYLAAFDAALAKSNDFERSVRATVRAVLASPRFLFRVESPLPEDGSHHAVDAYDIASRLSYFLWSTMPDDALLAAAKSGELLTPEGLQKQIDRMLADERSAALAEGFAVQWLDLTHLESFEPDTERYANLTGELRASMKREAVAFFHHVIRGDSPLTDLIAADYAYLNAPLAAHYGVGGVEGDHFRRVALSDPRRGGIVTLGAVLAATSYPRRTSPVLRGKWVLEIILGHETPPPPDNVKTLPAEDHPIEGLSFRQRLEKHRADPTCASCHDKIDPLGFALENYDVAGLWRDAIGDSPVDARGTLPTGESFTGPAELKGVLLARKDDVVRHLIERMLAYALGRAIEAYDAPVVDRIVAAVKADGYKGRTLVRQIAASYPFTHRRGRTPADAPTIAP